MCYDLQIQNIKFLKSISCAQEQKLSMLDAVHLTTIA